MAKDTRHKGYKRLKSRVLAKKRKAYSFDQALHETLKSLWGQRKQPTKPTKGNDGSAGLNEIQDNFNKRLALMDKNNSDRLRGIQEQNDKELQAVREEAEKSRKANMGISKSLYDTIQKMQQQKTQPTATQNTASTTESAENTEEAETGGLSFSKPSPKPSPINTLKKENNTLENPNEGIITQVIKNTLSIGQKVNLGDNYYRVTNLFGEREGSNAVPNRKGHSRGIDVVSHDAQGNKIHAPIAISDGTILGLSLDGSGKSSGLGNNPEGGYILNVQLDNGKIMRYMHLSPDIKNSIAELTGKRIKRGDILFEGDHTKWSGTGSGNHKKISITDVRDDGSMLLNYSDKENDPSTYLLYGKYV